jgi:hypothetical protein
MSEEDTNSGTIKSKLKEFENIDNSNLPEAEKMDLLIKLLESSNLNSDQIYQYADKVKNIADKKLLKEKFRPFYEISSKDKASREELIDRFEFLLNTSDIDSDDAILVLAHKRFRNVIKYLIGVLIIVIGLAVIITPVSKGIEIITLFHFNDLESLGINVDSMGLRNHGITLMDTFALIAIFTGILVLTSTKKKL